VCRLTPTWVRRSTPLELRLDEDALAGAFLGALDHGLELAVGEAGHAFGALRVALGGGVDLVAFSDVRKTVVEQGENVRRDLFAEAVTGAQILIDPDLRTYNPLIRRVRPG